MTAEQQACGHGVTFDEAEARKVLAKPRQGSGDAALDFVMGNSSSAEVQRRWPRGWFTQEKPCPVCGFVGIAYASYEHYTMGDW